VKVAVVHNSDHTGVIHRFGQECTELYGAKTVESVVSGLERWGHEVILCQGDKRLLDVLEAFMPPGTADGPTGMVFNMAYGIQGECRYTHVPAMLEMAGIPYTGSSPLGHALALDKVITKNLLRDAGIPTPRYAVMRRGDESVEDLTFPVVVKPRHESTSFGLQLVRSRRELPGAVAEITARYQQDALVEEYIEGREVCVALLGNEDMEFLPLVEQDFGDRAVRLVTWEDKMNRTGTEPGKICPAPIEQGLADRLKAISLATFRACRCRDYARVDIRIDADGRPWVLEINSMASLGATGSYVLAAQAAGYTMPGLVNRILDIAHRRYFGSVVPRPMSQRRPRGGPLELQRTLDWAR
jgi:D-alanine-D-alanine ligase